MLAEVFHVEDSGQVNEKQIRKVFSVFDHNRDGTITSVEFREAAIALGVTPSGDELAMLVKVRSSGFISTVLISHTCIHSYRSSTQTATEL